MPLSPLVPARTLATGRVLRRGVVLGVLALLERLLTAATAWGLFALTFERKVATGVALGVTFTVRTYLRQSLGSRTEADLIKRVIGSVLDGDVLRPSVLRGEDAQADLAQGAFLTARMLSDALPTLCADIVAVAVLGSLVAWTVPGRLVLGALALSMAGALAVLWSYGHLRKAVTSSWDMRDSVVDKMVDALVGRLEIVASGAKNTFMASVAERTRDWEKASVNAAAATLLSGRVPLLVVACAVALLVTADSRSLERPPILADVALLASVTPAFAGIAQGIVSLVQTEHLARALCQVIEDARPPLRTDALRAAHVPIRFEKVTFQYEGSRTCALTDVSFLCKATGSVGLSGANGAGKSTCLRLLLGLAAPTVGTIWAGDRDLRDLDVDSWRRATSFLPQKPYLPLRANVRSSVHLLSPGVSNARIEAALERVGVLESLSRIGPSPLEVEVDALSSGQRQRIALARMLCRDASLFVLDEPDANLDHEGISLVAELIRELASRAAVVFAAHTPQLLAVADAVVPLKGDVG